MKSTSIGQAAVLTAALLFAFHSPAQYTIPTSGLISWWRGEGNANDSYGTHNGNTPYGMAYGTGISGQCFSFDSSQRKVTLPDSPDFILTNTFSLMAWINPAATGQGAGIFMWRGDNRPGLDPYQLDVSTPGKVGFQIQNSLNQVGRVEAPVALNQWQFIVGTFNAGTMDLYVNGHLASQTTTSVVPIGALDPSYDPEFALGNHGGTVYAFPFNGLLDEAAIYNRALTPGEIEGIYTSVPEPNAFRLLCLGGAVVWGWHQKRRKISL